MHKVLTFTVYALLTSAAVAGTPATVWRTPSCGCCEAWVQHLRKNGFEVAMRDLPRDILNQKKSELGIQSKVASCHTAEIDGYVVEGHVPADDVKRLLKERPDAIGLTVPGMPLGSPGMENGSDTDPYDVLLVKKDGTTEVFAKH